MYYAYAKNQVFLKVLQCMHAIRRYELMKIENV